MRIRHGALSGQLRRPLEEQKIITQREGSSQHCKSNEYWINKYSNFGSLDQMDSRLAQFSRKYDEVIDEFANEFVQVHSNEKTSGLFKKFIPTVLLKALTIDIKPDTAFDDIIDLCFDLFWRCVDINLKSVRNMIEQTLKLQISNLFVVLQGELEVIFSEYPSPDLDRAIRTAQTDVQNALNQVSEWFRLRKSESEPTFSLEETIDIGLQCVKKIHPDFNPQISQQIPPMAMFLSLAILSDIFFIIFDNIHKHSGLAAPRVDVMATEAEKQIRITVRSEVGTNVDTVGASARVGRIKQIISEGSYQKGVRSEGGTGLMKLRKIIGQGLKESNHLDFGFDDDGRFFVDLELPYRELSE